MRPISRRLTLLICSALLGVGGCGGGASGENTDSASADSSAAADTSNGEDEKERKEKAISVTAARVARGELVLPVVAEGTIRARRSTEIRAEVGGRIEQIHVKEGQRVRAGQLIAQLDEREFRVAYEEARARYLKALGVLAIEEGGLEGEHLNDPDATGRPAELASEITELDRLERSGKITREERISRELELELKAIRSGVYRRDLIAARSGLGSAHADAERARLNLEHTSIVAPFDGVVTGLTLTRGEQVLQNETICSLVDNVDIEAEVGVLESDLGMLEVGRPALLGVAALSETLRVTVDVISPEVNRETRTCQVLLRLSTQDGRVKPGMFVRAAIAGKIYADRLMVPNEAILTRDGRPLLFKVEGDRAKWLYVELGERNDRVVEITKVLQGGPLEPGDRVVVSNHLTLTHDAKLDIKRTIDPEDPWAGTD